MRQVKPQAKLSVRVSGSITQLQCGCKCKDFYGISGNRFKKIGICNNSRLKKPGVGILQICHNLSDFFNSCVSTRKEKTRQNSPLRRANRTNPKIPG